MRTNTPKGDLISLIELMVINDYYYIYTFNIFTCVG